MPFALWRYWVKQTAWQSMLAIVIQDALFIDLKNKIKGKKKYEYLPLSNTNIWESSD